MTVDDTATTSPSDSESGADPRRLAETATFRTLDGESVAALARGGTLIALRPDEALFHAGEPYAQRLFVVYEGRLTLHRADGTVHDTGPGEIVGLSNYLDEEPYAATALGTADARVLSVPAEAVRELEITHPSLARLFNRLIAERVRARRFPAHDVRGALARPVRDLMKSPIATCGDDVSLRRAFAILRARKIGSLLVLDAAGEPLGLLTHAGLCEALTEKDAGPEDPVTAAACEAPVTIGPDEPLWRAEERLKARGVKYLMVVADGRPVGLLSQTDILRAVTTAAEPPSQAAQAADTAALRGLFDDLHTTARRAREANRLASRAVAGLSEAHLAIQRRCVELSLEALAAAGHGPPPRPYALLIMGSGGRREMLLDPDQDNGLILDDEQGPLSETETAWFRRFAEGINERLDQAGYTLCPGDIMARNPLFHKTLKRWREQFDHLLERPNENGARWSNIVFDFDTLHGDDRLTRALRAHLLDGVREQGALLGFMVEDDAEGRPPLGLFNRLVTAQDAERRGRIDVKRNGLRIIADAARIYALSAGIGARNTGERLHALVHQGLLDPDLADSVEAAYEELLDLLLEHQIAQRAAGRKPDKLVSPDEMSTHAVGALRAAMRAVKRFQDQLQGRFGRAAF